MEIISISKRDTLTPNEFRQLNTLIDTFDQCQCEAFAHTFVERLRGRKKGSMPFSVEVDITGNGG